MLVLVSILYLRMIPLKDLQLRKCSGRFYLRRENDFRTIPRGEQSCGERIRVISAVRPLEGKSICEWFPWFCIRGEIVWKLFVKTRFYHLPFTFTRKSYEGIYFLFAFVLPVQICILCFVSHKEWPIVRVWPIRRPRFSNVLVRKTKISPFFSDFWTFLANQFQF